MRILKVNRNDAGQRLDKFLSEMEIGTRSQVKEYIKKGLVEVNNIIIKKSDYKIDENTLALDKLFNDLGKRFEGVNGGYVKVLKLAPRKGDGAEQRLVIWSK